MAGISPVLYSIMFICVTVLKAEHVLSKNPTTWQTAKSTCESAGGSLLQQAFNLDEHDINVPVWLDGVVTSSPWMTNAGCYRYNAAEVKKHNVLHSSNSAVGCSKFCENELPIGLLEDACYCLKPNFNLQKASSLTCTKTCTGDSKDLCGGARESFDEYVTVYDGSHDIQTTDVTGNGECLAVVIKSINKKYMAQNCTNMLPVLCQNETTGHVEVFDTKTNWNGALQTCKANNLVLANDQFVLDNRVKKNQGYWVGYFRKSFPMWKQTGEVKNPIGCYLLENGESKVKNCSQLNHFICVKEKEVAIDPLTSPSYVSLTTRQPQKQKDEEDAGIDLPVIIGASVGGVVIFLVIVIAVVIICKRRRAKRETFNTKSVREPTKEQAALLHVEPGPEPKPKQTDTYCEPETLEQPAKSEPKMDDGEYDHLQLKGQRVSFNVDDGNLYDVSGTDTYGISHIDKAHKPQTAAADDTYDHTTNLLQ